ncbi:hypothetical protein RM530_18350 [Algiphilus sp. W345]|uniref:Lipoprotein n=1 Tax=Banduia mediterranea TaxID=3075609 RepID=A0ABU2WPQ6_9GAMM|nr:hypothetical protein [Algiphilus sp. W345]MDT0499306.1 hypothetical protein [Algiphilus sp. W345]
MFENAQRLLLVYLVLSQAVVGCGSASEKFKYDINVVNYGSHGVLINGMSHQRVETKNFKGISNSIVGGFYPELPAIEPTVAGGLKNFEGYEHALPEIVEITWQLALLSHCDTVYRSQKYPSHVRKTGCTWSPMDGKVFYKKVNMDAIRSSLAYKRAGKPVNGNYLYGEYTLNMNLIFNDDQLAIKVDNGQTGGLGQ